MVLYTLLLTNILTNTIIAIKTDILKEMNIKKEIVT